MSVSTPSSLPSPVVWVGWRTGGSRCSPPPASRFGGRGSCTSAPERGTTSRSTTGPNPRTRPCSMLLFKSATAAIARGTGSPLSKARRARYTSRSCRMTDAMAAHRLSSIPYHCIYSCLHYVLLQETLTIKFVEYAQFAPAQVRPYSLYFSGVI